MYHNTYKVTYIVKKTVFISFKSFQAWNNNKNRNNMPENPLLYARLSLQVVYC